MSFPAFAQQELNPDSDKPLEITAQNTLEWQRNEKLFIARGDALAQQGDVSISADTLTANYTEAEGSGIEISRVTATNNVVINSRENKAYGQQAVYDIDTGKAIMTGNNLRMVSPDQTVTARDSFEYEVASGRVTANGAARVDRRNPKGYTDTLTADKIVAVLKEDGQGKRTLDTLEAIGNVVITTPTEKVTGKYAIYRSGPNKAEISGGVVITRGPNILEGEKAEVDLNTNTSKMFSAPDGGERIRGVFYPGSEKKPEQ